MHDRWENLTEWRRPDGGPAALGEIPIEEGEVSPPDALEDMEPDEEHFQEATGNEGASFERTYRRAALVLWPQRRRLAVINQAGPRATLPYLESLAAKWIDEGAKPNSALWIEAHELSGHMLDAWPEQHWYGGRGRRRTTKTTAKKRGRRSGRRRRGGRRRAVWSWRVSSLRSQSSGTKRGSRLPSSCSQSAKAHDKADNDAILGAVALFPPERSARMIEAIIVGHAKNALAPCCGLLDAAIAVPFAAKPEHLASAPELWSRRFQVIPRSHPSITGGVGIMSLPGAGVVVDLVRIAEAVDAELAKRLAEHLLAWPQTYSLDHALVPAAKRLLGGGMRQPGAATKSLHAACLAHLEARAAEPLEVPGDWSRASNIRCRCEHCAALGRFLASPVTEAWTLKAAERIRRHVEAEIKAARCRSRCQDRAPRLAPWSGLPKEQRQLRAARCATPPGPGRHRHAEGDATAWRGFQELDRNLNHIGVRSFVLSWRAIPPPRAWLLATIVARARALHYSLFGLSGAPVMGSVNDCYRLRVARSPSTCSITAPFYLHLVDHSSPRLLSTGCRCAYRSRRRTRADLGAAATVPTRAAMHGADEQSRRPIGLCRKGARTSGVR